ncbi:MAG: ABC transporter substrate-binding protein [Myxococcaceae bacterium]
MLKSQMWRWSTLTAAVVIGSGCPQNETEPEEIKGTLQLRGLFDQSGPTADVGVSYSKGVIDAFREVNEAGGIRGYKVELQSFDYKYDPALALAKYNEWKADPSWGSVVSLMGWGTADAVKLSPEVARDEKPYVTASYAGILATPTPVEKTVGLPDGTQYAVKSSGAPYNFFGGTDYSTSLRIGLSFAKDKNAKKVAFAYCSAGYCTEPIAAGKTWAASIGLTVAPDIRPELTDSEEAIDQKMATYFAENPDVDWVWIGNSKKTAIFAAKAIKKYAPNARLIVNVFGFDETVYSLCGEPCVGSMYGVLAFAAYGDVRYPGMEEVVRIHDKFRKADGEDLALYSDVRYVQGYVSFLLWRKALEKVLDEEKEITGPNLKAALESFTNVDMGGLTAPITFSATDHRPTAGARIYSVNSFGKLQFEDQLGVELLPDWLGW